MSITDQNRPAGRMQGYFITGTDTGIGKTLVAAGLLRAASGRGLRTIGIKPVAAGCVTGPGGTPVNEDVLELRSASSIEIDVAIINPVLLEEPIAPHIAANRSGVHIHADELVRHCRSVCRNYSPEYVVVEGAGGWTVPLNATETMADFSVALGFPVIVVIGMKLGCLNHALLTVRAIQDSGLVVAGWVANCIEPEMPAFEENLQSLCDRLSAPVLGVIPYLGKTVTADKAAEYLQLDVLTEGGE
jgi:dethiobiotin synthetase